MTQPASSPDRRLAISAAAALVNVRQRIFPGALPRSSRLSTRSTSTLVLPLPAEAETQTEASGSAAWRCIAVASATILSAAGPMPPLIPKRTPRQEEHTSELQTLMRISYAVFCLKKTQHPECEQQKSIPHTYDTYTHHT